MDYINITDIAWQKIQEKLAISGHNSLRVSLSNKGCGGSSYVYNPTNDAPEENDKIITNGDYRVIVESKAAIFVIGSTLDWVVKDQFSQGFDIVNNSREISRCGCGESIILE